MSWFPQNKYVWDFWFAWDKAQRLHVFYLQASQLDCRFNPDHRHDRASVGHAVLTDWGWQEISPDQPVLTRALHPGAWDDLSIWTGSIIQSPLDDRYYLFYTSRRKEDTPAWTPHEWQRSQNIGVATSLDLYNWQRLEPNNLVIPNPGMQGKFDGVNWRDPYVVHNTQDNQFYAFICAHSDGDHDAGGIVAYVTSSDLLTWTSEPKQLSTSSDFYQMEVPQVFWRQSGDGTQRLYLLFCAQAKDCSRHRRYSQLGGNPKTGTYYLVSEPLPVDQPVDYQNIPWQGDAQLLIKDFYAGKLIWKFQTSQAALTLAPHTNVMFFGFQWGNEADHFVGGLSDPMPVQFMPDGTIAISSQSFALSA